MDQSRSDRWTKINTILAGISTIVGIVGLILAFLALKK